MSEKVVINACFGGFGLSEAGKRAYLARKGKQAFFYVEDRDSSKLIGERDYVRADTDRELNTAFMVVTVTENLGKRVTSDTLWNGGSYWDDDAMDRNDPDLVAVVEELGEVADGRHAKLSVIEIPDDVEWTIEEHDGLEHIAEAHRTWA